MSESCSSQQNLSVYPEVNSAGSQAGTVSVCELQRQLVEEELCVCECECVFVVALSQRSKEAESAFLGIYKQLIEAPGSAVSQSELKSERVD
ncbi:hypothetical protein E1301_Tti016641 [Triplophysa tibetana]|uniref:Uncharacterized protein n=1 Tax=Triplophysa tibetana TaxID=1572043 RepID=A0A5A9NXS2_9TELE|nr:hypothetical protein E1301_Tti016641 [Triplophysa tibetana]